MTSDEPRWYEFCSFSRVAYEHRSAPQRGPQPTNEKTPAQLHLPGVTAVNPQEVNDVPHATRPARFAHARRDSRSIETRIGAKIHPQPDGCWSYDPVGADGYGVDSVVGIVHRYVYETLVGPIPEGHHLHHECRNRACVRPSHLTPLTPADHAQVHADLRRAS